MRPITLGLHVIAAAILLLLLLHTANASIGSDRAALLRLRSAVGGRVLFWNTSIPTPCLWSGVICSPDNSSVVELHLPAVGLSGEIPPNSIANMTNLQTLSLRYNSLSGVLPADMFSSLTSLRNVYLQKNFFTGEIPNSLFSLTNLVRVNLADNRFSGELPVSLNNLTRLGTLYLQNNNFTGSIPDLNSPNLVQFDVSNNNLTGNIPPGLAGKPPESFTGNSLCGKPLLSCAIPDHRKKFPFWAIAVIIIGSVLGIFLISSILIYLCRRRGPAKARDEEHQVETRPEKAMPVFDTREVPTAEMERGMGGGSMSGDQGIVFIGNIGWNFDLEDLLRASAEVLGKGTIGTAYKAVLDSGLTMVVKRLRDINMGEKEFKKKMEEMGRMVHENVVPLRAYHYNGDEKLLVYDYLPMGSLSAILHGNKGNGRTPLKWDTRAAIALGAAKGILYIHSQGPNVSHGGIKSSNILLNDSYEPKISDFGLAQLGPTTAPHRAIGYKAPEVTDSHKVSQKADVYSFGVLLLELLTGKAPTHSLANGDGFDLPRWVQSVVREEWTAEVFDVELLRYNNFEENMVRILQLGVDCTAQYPDSRPSMAEVVAKIDKFCHLSSTNPSNGVIAEELLSSS